MKTKIITREDDGSYDFTDLANPGDVFTMDEQSDGSILLTPVLGPKKEEWYA